MRQIKKQWQILFPEFKNFKGYIFFRAHQHFISGFELIRLPHEIKEYSIYYQIFSMFKPISSLKELNPIISYQIKDKNDMQLNIPLSQSEEDHYKLMNKNLFNIKKQFIFFDIEGENFSVDYVLTNLDNFLKTNIFTENRISVYTFILQLCQFSDSMISDKIFEKYLNLSTLYIERIPDIAWSFGYKEHKQDFIKNLFNIPNDKKELKRIWHNNHLLLDNYLK